MLFAFLAANLLSNKNFIKLADSHIIVILASINSHQKIHIFFLALMGDKNDVLFFITETSVSPLTNGSNFNALVHSMCLYIRDTLLSCGHTSLSETLKHPVNHHLQKKKDSFLLR